MSKKRIIVILTSIIVILLMCLAIRLYCDSRLSMCKVYVAKYNIPSRCLISENELDECELPSSYFNNEVVLSKEEIVGKYVKINSYIPKGSFFYKGALENPEDVKDNFQQELENDELSYDINANNIQVNQANLIKGMYVDLYLTINKDRVVSDLLLNNVKIIGLFDSNNKEINDYDKESYLSTITLAVPKETVPYLNKAMVLGEISIIVGDHPYENVISSLNKQSVIFDYLY